MSNNSDLPEPPVEPLGYASRTEGAILLRAYACVGWYFLITAVISVLSAIGSALILRMQAPGMLAFLSQLTYTAPMAVVPIGAVGMIKGRPWGAYFLMVVAGLRMCVAAAGLLLLGGQQGTMGHYLSMNSVVVSSLQAFASAFLPYVMLRLCRQYNAFPM